MEDCPRFSFCNANKCPLDVDVKLRNHIEGEEKCGVAKSIRMRIGKKHGLPKIGLTDTEYSRKMAWDNKPEKEKEAIKSRLAKSAFQKQS